MRALQRLFAVGATLCLLQATTPTANATAHPRSDEWWFSVWGIEKSVWPLTKGEGVIVAVLDSGVNPKVPELAGAVRRGKDVIMGRNDGGMDHDTTKDGHGTAMAATIAARGGGKSGFVGIAPESTILPVTTIAGDTLTPNYTDFSTGLSKGIRYATDRGARVINMSIGSHTTPPDYCSSEVEDAIDYAIRHDIVLVAAAGNDGNTSNPIDQPASCPGVLTVGGIDEALRPWVRSDHQSYVSVAAPSTHVGWLGMSGTYYPAEGTSSAAALTSGAAALVRSRNPKMSARTVVQRLINTAKPIGSPIPNDRTGYGAIRISSAIDPGRFPVAATAPNPVYAKYDKWLAARHSSAPAAAPPASKRRVEHHRRFNWIPWGALAGLVVVVGVVVVFLRRRARGGVGRAGFGGE